MMTRPGESGWLVRGLFAVAIIALTSCGDDKGGILGDDVAVLDVSKKTITVSTVEGGPSPIVETFQIRNPGTSTLSWSISSDQPWLTVDVSSGTTTSEADTVTASIDISSLTAASSPHIANVTVSAPGSANPTQVITVTVTLAPASSPFILLSGLPISFTAVEGASNPAAQTFTIQNIGAGTLNWTVSSDMTWLTPTPTSDSNTGEVDSVSLAADISTLTSAGSPYTATVTAFDPTASNSPIQFPVTISVLPAGQPATQVSTPTLSFLASEGGASPADQTFDITNFGAGTLNWTITSDQTWLTATPTTGTTTTETDIITVSIDSSGLIAGTHTGTLTVNDPAASNGPQTVTVTIDVTSPLIPTIGISTTTLTFNATEGGASPAGQPFDITNTGDPGSLLNWTLGTSQSWLTVAPTSGTTTTETDAITVNVDSSGLTATGSPYVETVTIVDGAASNTPLQISVTVVIAPLGQPTISLSPPSLAFTAPESGPNPAPQTVTLTNTGTGPLVWNATSPLFYIQVSPDSGTLSPSQSVVLTITPVVQGAGVWSSAINAASAPIKRNAQSAVWTGNEMIVWGGIDEFNNCVNTGGRFDPKTFTWVGATSTVGAPNPRSWHSAVWTGTEMIIWGGQECAARVGDGAKYSPATDTWSPITSAGAPSARDSHTAVWTGTEMIVWGGIDGGATSSGGRYIPSTDTWITATNQSGAPSGRGFHSAAWTGTEMIIWGGTSQLNTGGRYNPSTDSWGNSTATLNTPTGRILHSAIWTGLEMIVWGGFDTVRLNSGGRYNPQLDRWIGPTVLTGAPTKSNHSAVWTGREMIIWGGNTKTESLWMYRPDIDLPAGTYSAPISIQSATATNSPQNLAVTLTVLLASPWSITTGDTGQSSPAIATDGTIYVGSSDFSVYAVNPDGTPKWTFPTGNSILSSPAIAADGTIYIGSQDNILYAINADGTEKWQYATGGPILSSPGIAADGTIYVGSQDLNLHAIIPDGSMKWKYAATNWIRSAPAIGTDGTIYVGSHDTNLYAINPNGTLRWSFGTGGEIWSSPAIAVDGTIYVGSSDSNVYAVNPDGTQAWMYPTGGLVRSSPALAADGTIYVGSMDGNLYALNSDGTLKWSRATGAAIESSPVVGADNSIYIGSNDFKLHLVNADGSTSTTFLTGGAVQSSPTIAADGTVYVGSDDGKLHAISGITGGLATTNWPKFHHNLQNTGKANGAFPGGLPIERVSISATGAETNGDSDYPAISGDGQFVVFHSSATGLVGGDSNGVADIFVYDRHADSIERVSVDSAGLQSNGPSENPSVSADGRFVVFRSDATNLVASDTNATSDIFVHDCQLNTTVRASVSSGSVEGNAYSGSTVQSISADGRYVVFHSAASNLVTGDANGQQDVFVRDLQSGTTTRASLDSGGFEVNSDSWKAAISGDGRYVGFTSNATNLIASDTNGKQDVFVHDRQTGTMERVNISTSGTQDNGTGNMAWLSFDGRYVSFTSDGNNLVGADSNGVGDMFVRDRQAGTTVRTTVSTAGIESNGDSQSEESISADGRFVVYQSNGNNLDVNDTNSTADIFVHDLQTGTTARVSVSVGGVEGNQSSIRANISADGRYVVFRSTSTDLIVGDTNGLGDIFVAPNPLAP